MIFITEATTAEFLDRERRNDLGLILSRKTNLNSTYTKQKLRHTINLEKKYGDIVIGIEPKDNGEPFVEMMQAVANKIQELNGEAVLFDYSDYCYSMPHKRFMKRNDAALLPYIQSIKAKQTETDLPF